VQSAKIVAHVQRRDVNAVILVSVSNALVSKGKSMSDEIYESRSPLGKLVETYFREKDSWERADFGRMGGHTYDGPLPSYEGSSDEELLKKYLEHKRNENAYEHDRR